jgi:hypothetical protein
MSNPLELVLVLLASAVLVVVLGEPVGLEAAEIRLLQGVK